MTATNPKGDGKEIIMKAKNIILTLSCLVLASCASGNSSTLEVVSDTTSEAASASSSSTSSEGSSASTSSSTSTSSSASHGGPSHDTSQGGGNTGGGGGDSSSSVSYSSVYTYSEDTTVSNASLSSTGTDENICLIQDGASVTFDAVSFSRVSSDSTGGDDASFYGVGASILTYEGNAYIKDSTIVSSAKGGAGVFSYGDGVSYVADTTIVTELDTAGGIHAAGGGTLYAYDLNVSTAGGSSAAIRSDRGGGTMVVDGGTYLASGSGSPAVYCTADIAVNNATLSATGSEAICIEGLNTLSLYDCDLSGNMKDDSQNDTTWTVTLYQSQSGDSEIGESQFRMVGGSLTSSNGGLFYTTNTESSFVLEGVDLNPCSDSEFLLMCAGNANERGWGSTGSNGAVTNFTAISQELEGDVIYDSISDLDFYLTSSSTLKGAFIDDESYAGSGGSLGANLIIDSSSTWTVTGDSTLVSLSSAGTIVDESGNAVSIVSSSGSTYVSGTSSYTITVDSYSTSADTSGAESAGSFSDYEIERPSILS